MSEYDGHSNVRQSVATSHSTLAASVNSDSALVDTSIGQSVEHYIHIGAVAGVGALVTVTLFENDVQSQSGWTQVDSDEVLGSISVFGESGTDKVIRLGSIGKKRYQGFQLVPNASLTGTSEISAISVVGHPESAPMDDATIPA